MSETEETPVLTYTQHTVAWPNLRLDGPYDEVGVSLDYLVGGGVGGEFNWRFHRFDRHHQGAQLECFGDGLPCLYDPRVQQVVSAWRAMETPDDLTPAKLIELLEAAGAVASEHHKRGQK
jgi:hypothetical protein